MEKQKEIRALWREKLGRKKYVYKQEIAIIVDLNQSEVYLDGAKELLRCKRALPSPLLPILCYDVG